MTTEQNKQEAEKVVDEYLKYCHYSTDRTTMSRERATEVRRKYAIECAIINRQSVLEALNKVKDFIAYPSGKVGYEITNLTEQINFLQSKL